MKHILLVVVLLISLSGVTYGQQYNGVNFKVTRMKLEENRHKFVEKNLMMTKELSDDFWPLYKRYRTNVKIVDEKTISLIKIYAEHYSQDTITNEKAAQLMSEFMALDKRRLTLKDQYIKIFSAKLPEKLVWRFFHIESNLDTMIKNSYISQIPMVNL